MFFLLVVSFDVFYFLFCSVFSLTSFHSLLLTKILWRAIQAKRQCIYCLLDLLQYLGLWLVNCHACYKNTHHLKTIINNAIQVVNRYWLQTGRHQPNQFTYILLRIDDDEENIHVHNMKLWCWIFKDVGQRKGVIIKRFFSFIIRSGDVCDFEANLRRKHLRWRNPLSKNAKSKVLRGVSSQR